MRLLERMQIRCSSCSKKADKEKNNLAKNYFEKTGSGRSEWLERPLLYMIHPAECRKV